HGLDLWGLRHLPVVPVRRAHVLLFGVLALHHVSERRVSALRHVCGPPYMSGLPKTIRSPPRHGAAAGASGLRRRPRGAQRISTRPSSGASTGVSAAECSANHASRATRSTSPVRRFRPSVRTWKESPPSARNELTVTR